MRLLIFLMCFATAVYADGLQDYQSAQAFIANHPLTQSDVAQADTHLPEIKANKAASDNQSYYSDPDSMATQSLDAIQKKPGLKAIGESAGTRPRMSINPNTDFVKNSQKLQQNAEDIITHKYKDCDKKVYTEHVYVNKTCTAPNNMSFDCEKELQAHAQKPVIPIPCYSVLRIDNHSATAPQGAQRLQEISWVDRHFFIWKHYAYVDYYKVPSTTECLLPGTFITQTDSGDRVSSISLPALVPATFHINALHGGTVTLNINGMPATDGTEITNQSATSAKSYALKLHSEQHGMAVAYALEPANPPETISQQWINHCPTQLKGCNTQHSRCLDVASTKSIDGVSITEPCWRMQYHINCGTSNVPDTCQTLQAQNCQQISSRCTTQTESRCPGFNETWSCPTTKKIGTSIACGDAHAFCLNGSCQQTATDKNTNIGDASTKLAAMNSTAEDVKSKGTDPSIKPSNIEVFKGRVARCRDITLGIMNCCRDTGWAKGIITHCSDEEKDLGKSKQKGLVVEVGRYCSHKFIWCTEHKKSYCIFPSKIALDVQLHGRGDQLHRGFGSAENPDCSGISPDAMSRIDFDKIDFSNAVGDITAKRNTPNESAVKNSAEGRVNDMIAKDMPHA